MSTGVSGILRFFVVVLLCAVLVLGQNGCLTQTAASRDEPSLRVHERVAVKLGKVGVKAAPDLPEEQPVTSLKQAGRPERGWWARVKSGARSGAQVGLKITETISYPIIEGFGRGAGNCGDACLVLLGGVFGFMLAGTMVGAVVGGVAGGLDGMIPKEMTLEEVNAARPEVALKKVVAWQKIQETMRDHVARSAQTWISHDIVSIPTDAPAGADVDTVLETRVVAIGLLGAQQDPYQGVRLSVDVNARLVRRMDSAVLAERVFYYTSEPRTLREWATDQARPVRDELSRGYEFLARQIVNGMLAHAR